MNEYQFLEKELKTLDGKPIEVTPLGSLGLLAFGDIGLIVWRAKRNQFAMELLEKDNKKNKN